MAYFIPKTQEDLLTWTSVTSQMRPQRRPECSQSRLLRDGLSCRSYWSLLLCQFGATVKERDFFRANRALSLPMFRLPTHLESLVPPPREQVPQTRPWRGRIFTPASFPDPATQSCEIRVTAAETEYDK